MAAALAISMQCLFSTAWLGGGDCTAYHSDCRSHVLLLQQCGWTSVALVLQLGDFCCSDHCLPVAPVQHALACTRLGVCGR
jgi:hypothetical protein